MALAGLSRYRKRLPPCWPAGRRPGDRETLFDITAASLDAIFRKVRTRAAIEAATFHNTLHLAITSLAKKVDVLELARMVGHQDLKQLLVYYNAHAETTATRLY
jgi:integrase